MFRLFVTLAVLVIVRNDMTLGHFHHPGFPHGPGHHPDFPHGPGHHPDFHHGPGHHPGFHHGPGHHPGFHHGPGHHHGFHDGPGHHPDFPHGHGSHKCGASEIRNEYAEALDMLHKSCQNNSIVPIIVYSTTSYAIIYNLPETKDIKVNVTIQNQILNTQVTGTGTFKGFSDVRVLPDILELSEATWMFQGTDLKILIPYKVQLGTPFKAECTPGNGSIIQVPNPPLPNIFLRNSEN